MDMHHAGHGTESRTAHPPRDPAAGHGMAVVGTDMIFLSHLPMFMRPHDYQVILHGSFGAADAIYRQDRKEHPKSKLYTFAPVSFVLPDLFPEKEGAKARSTSFTGSLVRNHFEQPPAHPERPVEIAPDVAVEVLGIVHHHKFDPHARAPEHLTYVLFGKGQERFVAHLITRPPDFDQLVAVDVTGHELSDEQLLQGVELVVADRRNAPAERLKEGETVSAAARVGTATVPVELRAGVELYFETSDLSQAM